MLFLYEIVQARCNSLWTLLNLPIAVCKSTYIIHGQIPDYVHGYLSTTRSHRLQVQRHSGLDAITVALSMNFRVSPLGLALVSLAWCPGLTTGQYPYAGRFMLSHFHTPQIVQWTSTIHWIYKYPCHDSLSFYKTRNL